MRRLLALLAGLIVYGGPCSAIAANSSKTAPWTQQILVGTTATEMGIALTDRQGALLLNRGPNSIFCALQDPTKAVLNKAHEVKTGGEWPINAGHHVKIHCICSVLQVDGAGTILTQGK